MPEDKDQSTTVCKCCNTNITKSMALTQEGKDYIYHFCGESCLEGWQSKNKKYNKDDKENT